MKSQFKKNFKICNFKNNVNSLACSFISACTIFSITYNKFNSTLIPWCVTRELILMFCFKIY